MKTSQIQNVLRYCCISALVRWQGSSRMSISISHLWTRRLQGSPFTYAYLKRGIAYTSTPKISLYPCIRQSVLAMRKSHCIRTNTMKSADSRIQHSDPARDLSFDDQGTWATKNKKIYNYITYNSADSWYVKIKCSHYFQRLLNLFINLIIQFRNINFYYILFTTVWT